MTHSIEVTLIPPLKPQTTFQTTISTSTRNMPIHLCSQINILFQFKTFTVWLINMSIQIDNETVIRLSSASCFFFSSRCHGIVDLITCGLTRSTKYCATRIILLNSCCRMGNVSNICVPRTIGAVPLS